MSVQPSGELEIEPIAENMLAWQATGVGSPADVLSLTEIDVPRPGAGEVLIEVWSAGLGASDVRQLAGDLRFGGKPATPPYTVGLQLCGEIVAVGEGVTRSRLGERVIGVTAAPHGSLAKYAVARAKDVMPAPTRLDDASAAVFHLPYQIGWMGLYRRASVRVGEWLVVHEATGGLGSAAVQLGRAAGATVVAVVDDGAHGDVARSLGAQHTVHRAVDVVREVRELTNGAGADVVFDPVGGAALEESVRMAAFEGRVVTVGAAPGGSAAVDAAHLLAGNVSLIGVGWAAYLDARPEVVVRAHADLDSLVEVGALHPLVAAKVDFEDAPEHLAALVEAGTPGQLAVSPP